MSASQPHPFVGVSTSNNGISEKMFHIPTGDEGGVVCSSPGDFHFAVRNSYPDGGVWCPACVARDQHESSNVDLGELTERQYEALQTAIRAGYFETPREKTGAEVGREMNITQPTFNHLLRAALRAVLGQVPIEGERESERLPKMRVTMPDMPEYGDANQHSLDIGLRNTTDWAERCGDERLARILHNELAAHRHTHE